METQHVWVHGLVAGPPSHKVYQDLVKLDFQGTYSGKASVPSFVLGPFLSDILLIMTLKIALLGEDTKLGRIPQIWMIFRDSKIVNIAG